MWISFIIAALLLPVAVYYSGRCPSNRPCSSCMYIPRFRQWKWQKCLFWTTLDNWWCFDNYLFRERESDDEWPASPQHRSITREWWWVASFAAAPLNNERVTMSGQLRRSTAQSFRRDIFEQFRGNKSSVVVLYPSFAATKAALWCCSPVLQCWMHSFVVLNARQHRGAEDTEWWWKIVLEGEKSLKLMNIWCYMNR